MKKYLALGSFVAAVLFAATSLFMEPPGEIDSSVLVLVAQLLLLCATFLGVKQPLFPNPFPPEGARGV